MVQCWNSEPNKRPNFRTLTSKQEQIILELSEYLGRVQSNHCTDSKLLGSYFSMVMSVVKIIRKNRFVVKSRLLLINYLLIKEGP